MKPRIALLVSGGGRSLENLAEVIARGELQAEIALVLSNTPQALALRRAERLGLDALVVRHGDFAGPDDFGRAVFDAVEARGCELVVLAGFLRLLPVPDAWLGRVINIHPALLPKFGGVGYYGDRVHRAVLAAGEVQTGCTVHYVTNEFDAGPPILQRAIAVEPDDTPERLAARVFEQERRALPEAIRRHLAGEVRMESAPEHGV